MTDEQAEYTIRPVLFYKDTCRPCIRLSQIALMLSLGHIHRVPIRSKAAQDLYARYPEHRGRLVLRHGANVWFGRHALTAIPAAVLRTWGRAAMTLLRFAARQKERVS